MPKLGRALVFAPLLAVLVAACSSGSSSGPSSSASTGAATSTTLVPASLVSQAAASPLKPYPSQSGNLPTVTLGLAVQALSFAGVQIAQDMNFFKYMGVNVDVKVLAGDTGVTQALVGNSIDLGSGSANGMVSAAIAGASFQTVGVLVSQTSNVCVSKSWVASHHVTANSTLEQKVQALKGAAFGITGPKSNSDNVARLLLSKYGHLNPDTDATFISLATSAALTSGLDANRIQAFVGSPPACEQANDGVVLIHPSEVPGFKNSINEIFYGDQSWVTSNTDLVTRVSTALAMANNFILKHTATALTILQQQYPALAPSSLDEAFKTDVLPAVVPNCQMTTADWQATMTLVSEFGSQTIPTPEGQFWTNKYINLQYANVS